MKKIILPFLLLVTFACNKNETAPIDPVQLELSSKVSQDDGQVTTTYSTIFDDVMGTSDEVGVAGSGIFGKENGIDTLPPRCFQVLVTHPQAPLPFPVVVTITFPPSGCMGRDGRVRRGQIRTEYSNRLIIPNAQATTTFIGFSIDSVLVGGTHVIKNLSTPTEIKWQTNTRNGRLGFPNGNVIEWNDEKVLTQIEGGMTALPFDDIFKITAVSTGTSIRSGVSTTWRSETTEPLIKKFSCPWIVKGILRTVRTTLPTNTPWVSTLNFGNGGCDDIAVLTVNGQSQTIHLH